MPVADRSRWSLRGVIFDCDGLLLDTESRWTISERATVARWNGDWSEHLERDLLGSSVPAAAAVIARHVGAPLAEVDLIAEALERGYAGALERHGCEARPGIPELVDALWRAGIPLAIASNSARALVDAALAHTGLSPRFSEIVCAGDHLAPKPSPDVYVGACGALGVDPQEAVALEDSQPGVDAARAAGLRVIGVPSLPAYSLDADAVVASVADLAIGDLEAMLRSGAGSAG